MGLELQEVASNLGFPEGPVAMNDGSVLFVDIKRQTLMRLQPGKKPKRIAKLPGGPNGCAIGPDGAAYICNNGGVYTFPKDKKTGLRMPNPYRPDYRGGSIQRVDLKSGEVTTLYTKYKGKKGECIPLIAPDDIVFDTKRGGFWFTDTGKQDGTVSQSGAVYFATIDGKTLKYAAMIPTANGIGLSPKGDKLFVSDTVFGRLWALDIAGPGVLKPGFMNIFPGNVVQTLPNLQWLDSLKVLKSGSVCVGTLLIGGITVFHPDQTTEHVEVPDPFTTNLCFGGDDMRDVWITASGTGKIYKTRWPEPGLKLAHQV